jgi:glycosyltransferase involved in cell wall biosynthesis
VKIIHTEASTGWGGQEIRILKEAIGMRKKGYEIVFVTEINARLKLEAEKNNFRTYDMSFKRKNWLFSFFKLKKIFKQEKVSIVNTHSSLDAWLAGITAKIIGIPVIRTRHLSAKVKPGINSFLLYNYLANFVVTTCAKIIPIIAKQSNKPLKFFQSIPTGINPKEIIVNKKDVISFRQEFNIQQDDILVGTVCFMRSWKGIEEFFQAAYHLKDKKNLRWVIIGGGHIETYRKKAKDYQVDNIIIFTGHLQNPYHAIDALDIFTLLSSANEGVSQASLQAAFLKKPIIATPTGGLCEVCIDGKTGFLVPIFSYECVVKAVIKLAENHNLRKTFGLNANQLVLEKFTYEKMLCQMNQIYQSFKMNF